MARLKITSKHRLIVSQMLLGLFLGLLAIGTIFISPLLILESSTILKMLIEIGAAMLGFWGIILVYALASLDNRLDSLETQKFEVAKIIADKQEISISLAMEFPDEHLKFLENKIQKLTNSFKKLRREGIINSAILIVSIVVSVIGLGMPENVLALLFIIIVSLYYFVVAVVFIFMSFWSFRPKVMLTSENTNPEVS